MTDIKLATQYNDRAKLFEDLEMKYNEPSRTPFYAMWPADLKNKSVLDVGCGFGTDLKRARGLGAALCTGIDASEEFIKRAKQNLPGADLRVGFMEKLPYANEIFDTVISRYVVQTSPDVPGCLDEMVRVLKVGGDIVYLTVDPFRTFVEKGDNADYFKQAVMKSEFFGGNFSTMEPTHTFGSYLNPKFLKQCHITDFGEYEDFNSAIRVGNKTYPCFMIFQAKKVK